MKRRFAFLAIGLFCAMGAFEAAAEGQLNELMYAAWHGNTAEARRLIADGADVNVKDKYGQTALMWAAQRNATDTARLLLESDADVSAKDNDGKTALMHATDNDATDVAELLKAAGAR